MMNFYGKDNIWKKDKNKVHKISLFCMSQFIQINTCEDKSYTYKLIYAPIYVSICIIIFTVSKHWLRGHRGFHCSVCTS